jgi:hypothetical protein
MLTILHDEMFAAGRLSETASAEGVSIVAVKRATCRLAQALIEAGFDPQAPARLVKADPYLSSPPHRIDGLTLSLAAKIDFFGAPDETLEPSLHAPAGPTRRV